VSDPVRFLTGLSQALSTVGLYGDGHPASARSVEGCYRQLTDLQQRSPILEFTFLPDEVMFGRDLLPELENWEWSTRLAQAGVERLEVTGPIGVDQFERFLSHLARLLGLRSDDRTDIWQGGPATIRFGRVRVDASEREGPLQPLTIATMDYSLREEREAVGWLHGEVATGGRLPLIEAEGVVRSLALAMHGGQAMVLPLLQLKEFDQYTTTHSINVAVLSMALGEFMGAGPAETRAFGLAGLLHDLGKVRIPREILNKPGKLTPEERDIIEAHPADGARMILEGEEPLDLAAAVAYEHHLCINGTGYPRLRYPRQALFASRLVHVCDVYDALRTRRPYRDAWSSAEALGYIKGRSGSEFDSQLVEALIGMMGEWDNRVALQPA
jgi:putative nucleotidyltransferase with HDIG domain